MHKPCLYNSITNGDPIFLPSQVDNYTVAAPNTNAANACFVMIQKGLNQPMKRLGILTVFNGINVSQGNRFIKLPFETFYKNT